MQTNTTNNPNPILITGANGYLASYLIKLLLEKDFKVRGTVRSLANKSSHQFLYDMIPDKANINLELIEADLTDKDVWASATKGVQYIFHLASPLPDDKAPLDDEEYFVKPAVSGTLNLLEAALKNNVKKVVVTSSIVAIAYWSKDKIFTEEDWEDEKGLYPYPKSKIRAEKAVWEFYEKNKEEIEVAVVNPGFVLGPRLNVKDGSTRLLAAIMDGVLPGIFETIVPIVDVRDVAEVHYQAMLNNKANGKRYLCNAECVSLEDIVHWLNQEFGNKGVKISEEKVNVEEVLKSEDPGVQIIGVVLGQSLRVDNKKSKEELGIEYRPVKQTIIDCGESLFKFGVVKEKK